MISPIECMIKWRNKKNLKNIRIQYINLVSLAYEPTLG